MKKIIFVLLITIILLSVNLVGAGEKKIKIATDGTFSPFTYVDPESNKLMGFDIDIANSLSKAAGIDCEFVIIEWEGLLPGLLAKKYDGVIGAMSITEERLKSVNFTDPYCQMGFVFVGKKDSGIKISEQGLKGKIVGLQRATTHGKFMKTLYPKTKLNAYDNSNNMFLDLLSKRVDLAITGLLPAQKWIEETPEAKDYEIIGEPITDEKYIGKGFGIALRKDNPELLAKLNKALATIIKNDTHKKISSKYFNFDIFNY